MNLINDKKALFEILQHFRGQGYSFHDIRELVSELLVYGEIIEFEGNRSKASASLGISSPTLNAILNKIERKKNGTN